MSLFIFKPTIYSPQALVTAHEYATCWCY